jgi:prophage regulatory protein
MSADEDRLIALPRVKEIAGIGKTMIYRLVREGRFPAPCHPGGASTRWSEREVRAWRDEQLRARAA